MNYWSPDVDVGERARKEKRETRVLMCSSSIMNWFRYFLFFFLIFILHTVTEATATFQNRTIDVTTYSGIKRTTAVIHVMENLNMTSDSNLRIIYGNFH